MYVCLCRGITSQTVSDAVAAGASTSNQVAAACGAGTDCARCRHTIQTIIAAHKLMPDATGSGVRPPPSDADSPATPPTASAPPGENGGHRDVASHPR